MTSGAARSAGKSASRIDVLARRQALAGAQRAVEEVGRGEDDEVGLDAGGGELVVAPRRPRARLTPIATRVTARRPGGGAEEVAAAEGLPAAQLASLRILGNGRQGLVDRAGC